MPRQGRCFPTNCSFDLSAISKTANVDRLEQNTRFTVNSGLGVGTVTSPVPLLECCQVTDRLRSKISVREGEDTEARSFVPSPQALLGTGSAAVLLPEPQRGWPVGG